MSVHEKVRVLEWVIAGLLPLDLICVALLIRLVVRDRRRWKEQQERQAYLDRQNRLFQELGRALQRTRDVADAVPTTTTTTTTTPTDATSEEQR